MPRDPEVEQAAESWQLGLPRIPVAGRSGDLLGRGTGSSLEFQEYRQYAPGDDVRHLDWAAYARSDTLMVRLYREEISPRLEILVDASRSMNSGERAKPILTRQLAWLFALLGSRIGGKASVAVLDDNVPIQPGGIEALDRLYASPLTGGRSLWDLLQSNLLSLKPHAVRIVISDFLFPHDPSALIRRLASNATTLWVIQLLNAWEASPQPVGGRKLVDVETGAETDLFIDRRTIAEYLARLNVLQNELRKACRQAHARIATLIAERGIAELCRVDLVAAEMLRPA